MDIISAFIYFKQGYRIKRPKHQWYFHICQQLSSEDILSNDWEILTENIIQHFPITYKR
jgi:hypothetical protein